MLLSRLIWTGESLIFNDAYVQMLGYSPEEIRTLSYQELTPEKWHATEEAIVLEQIIARGYSDVYQKEYRRKDGTIIPVELRTILARDADGRPASMWAIARDITESKRAEETLQHEKNLLQAIMNGPRNVHLVYLDRDFNFVRVNEAYAATCGYRPDEMIGKNHFALYPNAELEDIFTRVRDNGEIVEIQDRPFIFPDQPERGITYWNWTLTPERDPSGQVAGLIFALVETTERKQAEETLRESEEKYRRLFTEAGLGIFHSTFDDRFIDLNPALAQMLGYESPKDVMESIHSISQQIYVDPPRRDLIIEKLLEEGKTVITENRYYQKSGEEWIARLLVRQVADITGQPLYLEGFIEDITDRKRMEEALQKSERRYSALFANKINGMAHCKVITDEHGRPVDYWIVEINQAYEEIIGIKKADIEGRRVTEVFPDIKRYAFDYIGVYGKIALEGSEIKFEEYFEATGQHLSIYAYSPHPGEFAAIFTDVTDRKKAEEELGRSRDDLELRVQERTKTLYETNEALTAEIGRRNKAEKEFRTLADNAPDIILRFDRNLRYTYVNPAFEMVYGLRAEDFLGKTDLEVGLRSDVAQLLTGILERCWRLVRAIPSNGICSHQKGQNISLRG